MRSRYLTGLLALSTALFALPGLAAPKPKAAWIRGARQRLAKSSKWNSKRSVNGSACVETASANFSSPKANIWSGLTDYEAASVTAWLFQQSELNLTRSEDAGAWDNSILLMELMIPNKTDALSYIDGNASAPTRYAHVSLDLRASENPTYTDILVGPLPVQNGSTTWQPLEYPYTRKTGGSIRNLDADSDQHDAWLHKVGASISDITLDLWGGTATGADNDTLDIWGIDPLWQYDGKITRWDTFWHLPTDEFDAETLLPLGLFFKSDVTGRDPSKWKLEGWLYNDIFYPTTEAFRAAYWSGNFTKLGGNVEGDWARTDKTGPVLPMDNASPPVAVAPSGARFSVDPDAKYVEWMDFSFYIGFSRDTALALYDIRHKGQRILYELGLQEALAHYAGNDPVQSGTSYLDAYYGFGPYAFELVPGYDCPAYASYLNTSFYVSETTHTHINSVCFFEFDAGYPMQRHSTSSYVSNIKNVQFVVRSVSTVGNYDYM
jgi:primary-amine oxidase